MTKIYSCYNGQIRAVFKTLAQTKLTAVRDDSQPVTKNRTLFFLKEYTSSAGGWAHLIFIRQNPGSIPDQKPAF
jgi:hypothetical protein